MSNTNLSKTQFPQLLLATGLSNLTDGIFKVILPISVIDLGGTAFEVGIATAILATSWPVFGMIAGACSDVYDRRKIVVISSTSRTIALLFILIATMLPGTNAIFAIFVATAVFAAAEAFSYTAQSGIITKLVPKDRRSFANSRLSLVRNSAGEFGGPFLAATLTSVGFICGYYVSAFSCLTATLLIYSIKGDYTPIDIDSSFHKEKSARTALADIKKGLVFLMHHRELRTMAIMASMLAGGWGVWMAVMPVHLAHNLVPNDAGAVFGTFMMVFAAGGLLGASLTGFLAKLFDERTLLLSDFVGTFLALITPASTDNLILIGISIFLCGAGGSIWGIIAAVQRQNLSPDNMLGRVTGAFRLVAYLLMPVFALIGGNLAERVPIPTLFAVFSVIPIIGCVYAMTYIGVGSGWRRNDTERDF
ncbi:MFS transporter [Brucella sp. NBRC 12950]|uniref:MFS transporter n=1 Tax=Brucella sp. NBRC 12950 TaxID=2994518 RepID=UPI0024A30341|nr:MFS transporter [Brucella sp. NBRC 12950]GLU27920.1 hypothetical protein Brsp01_31530 [Brucella sp. NBRC 12950]